MTKLVPNQTYHIYNHANGSENLFRNQENYAYFLRRYAHFIHPIAKTYSYCLLPNHFHLLIKIRSEEEIHQHLQGLKNLEGVSVVENFNIEKKIVQQFSNFFNSYTKSYNKCFKRRGALFCHNFRRKLVLNDAYFTAIIQYIHNNPVHHGFTNKLESWQWSSYHSFISTKKTLLEKKEIIEWFGNIQLFIEAHQSSNKKLSELCNDDFY